MTCARDAARICETRASRKSWNYYEQLPTDIQRLVDQSYELLKRDPRHGSLHFKKVGRFWSTRVGIHYEPWRSRREKTSFGFGLDIYSEYDRLIGSR